MKKAGVLGLLLAASFGAHFHSLGNDFTRDDFLVVRDNPFVQDWRNLPKLFDRDAYLSDPSELDSASRLQVGSGESTYRPAATFSYFILYSLFGEGPLGYHAGGIALHGVNAFLAYLVLLYLFKSGRGALFAALLFAAHPVHVEAVNSVSCNEDLLAFFFMTLGLLAHIHRRPALSAAAFFAACLSKEMALSFPALMALCDLYGPEKKIDLKRYRYGAAAFLLYVWARFFEMGSSFPLIGYVLGTFATVPKSFAHYVLWLVWPADILPMMPDDPNYIASSWMQPDALVPLAFCAALLATAFLWRKRYPVYSFSVFWFFIALIPLGGLARNTIAPHNLYIPSLGFFALTGGLFSIKNNLAGIFFGTVFLAYCFLSFISHFTWRSDLSLFEAIIERQPENPVAHSAMGSIYSKWGDDGAAAAEYRVAIALDPDWPKDWVALARATARRGFVSQGRELMEKAQKLVDGKADI